MIGRVGNDYRTFAMYGVPDNLRSTFQSRLTNSEESSLFEDYTLAAKTMTVAAYDIVYHENLLSPNMRFALITPLAHEEYLNDPDNFDIKRHMLFHNAEGNTFWIWPVKEDDHYFLIIALKKMDGTLEIHEIDSLDKQRNLATHIKILAQINPEFNEIQPVRDEVPRQTVLNAGGIRVLIAIRIFFGSGREFDFMRRMPVIDGNKHRIDIYHRLLIVNHALIGDSSKDWQLAMNYFEGYQMEFGEANGDRNNAEMGQQ